MKRYGHLFEQITSYENCRKAILEASKKKRSRKQVIYILTNLDFFANELSLRLQYFDFLTQYTYKVVRDQSSGKERELLIPSFYPDQCAHHAIMRVLKPIFLKSSYKWSCANIPNRGIDKAAIGVKRATHDDVKNSKYCVKMDIQKFYPSINHDVLKARLRRKIKDEKVLRLLDIVIDSVPKGLPLGNYTSPWLAEFLLQPLDHYIKQQLKVIHYVRYADDMVLTGSNKRKLRKAMLAVIQYAKTLGLTIKHDYQLFRIQNYSRDKRNRKGRKIDFVGRCFAHGAISIRKRRSLAFIRQSRRIQKLIALKKPIPYKDAAGFLSRSACLKNTNSAALKAKYYDVIKIRKLKEIIRNESKRKSFS